MVRHSRFLLEVRSRRAARPRARSCSPRCMRALRECAGSSSVTLNFNSLFKTGESNMAQLTGSKTHQNLKDAFAGESQANRRYLYFAKQADVEGYPDVGGLFRDTAEAETGHAHGHLDYLKQAGDPATGKPIGATDQNLAAAVAGETYEYTE